jgi:hypothetical protein
MIGEQHHQPGRTNPTLPACKRARGLMRFDHIVIHVDNDTAQLQALQTTLNDQGYPFDPETGRRSLAMRSSNINIGDEYIEVVRLRKHGIKKWMPLWAQHYEQGLRGAYCIFLEVEDVERTAVALKKAGVAARGPAELVYPELMGLIHHPAPYFIYYMPEFPGTHLQIALMQYNKTGDREHFLDGLFPNAQLDGINGIRRIEVALPRLEESLPMLRLIFPDLRQENGCWVSLAEKTRLAFAPAPGEEASLCVHAVTSQRHRLGQSSQIENVTIRTTGG